MLDLRLKKFHWTYWQNVGSQDAVSCIITGYLPSERTGRPGNKVAYMNYKSRNILIVVCTKCERFHRGQYNLIFQGQFKIWKPYRFFLVTISLTSFRPLAWQTMTRDLNCLYSNSVTLDVKHVMSADEMNKSVTAYDLSLNIAIDILLYCFSLKA